MLTAVAHHVYTIADVLGQDECDALIAWSESLGYEPAPISLAGGPEMHTDLRNNGRVMVDAPDRAAQLWSRIAEDLAGVIPDRRAVGLNERLRFYRYDAGQRFAPHTDGCFRRPTGEESLLTLMIYLSGDLVGGETRFEDASVIPEPGLALVFDHYLVHEGAPVVRGRKYVLRSDVMYDAE